MKNLKDGMNKENKNKLMSRANICLYAILINAMLNSNIVERKEDLPRRPALA